jgi:branched-chain amino acid transport system ATP-binding protein
MATSNTWAKHQGQGAWDLVKQGLVMVPEGRGVFARMTITENLQMGAYIRNDKAGILADIEKMFTIFPRLRERKDQLAGTMSGGEQQMLAMGRALMSRPRCCCWTSPPWACRPSWWTRSSRWCATCTPGRDHPAGRAERQPRAGHCRPRLRDGVGPDHHDRPGQDLLSDPKVRAAYLGESTSRSNGTTCGRAVHGGRGVFHLPQRVILVWRAASAPGVNWRAVKLRAFLNVTNWSLFRHERMISGHFYSDPS